MSSSKLIKLAEQLWPIHRSILGPGFRKSLKILKKEQNKIIIKSIKSGSKVFDWKIPNEWHIYDAWIKFKNQKILDYKDNNLHVVGYSKNIKKKINLSELKKKLHFIKKLPTAIPYVTSYYKKYWGFCIEYNKYKKLHKGIYEICIKSKFKKGNLNYGEIIIKGTSKKEIMFSTYLCHPSLANNEISGPCVVTFLSKYIQQLKNKYYTYRFVFIPETIGSISYLNKNYDYLKKNLIAGFNVTCVGDDREYSYISSRKGNNYADYVAKKIMQSVDKKFKKYSWLDRGSDERQYCSPGIDLPFCTISRSKFGTFKEYHNSKDVLGKVVTKRGLSSSLQFFKKIINFIENHYYYDSVYKCEPFMTKRNLYNSISKNENSITTKNIMNVLSFCDGKTDFPEISSLTKINLKKTIKILKILEKNKLIYKKKY